MSVDNNGPLTNINILREYTTMDLITAQVHKIAATADETARKTLIDTLRNLSISLEEPGDTVQRLAYLVSNSACATRIDIGPVGLSNVMTNSLSSFRLLK